MQGFDKRLNLCEPNRSTFEDFLQLYDINISIKASLLEYLRQLGKHGFVHLLRALCKKIQFLPLQLKFYIGIVFQLHRR